MRISRWVIGAMVVPSVLALGSAQAFAYSGANAASYADTWYDSRNPNYPTKLNDDCTNFVSQALHAGGQVENADFDSHTGLYVDTTDDHYWFYAASDGAYSNSWSVSEDLFTFLTYYGDGTLIGTASGNSTASTDGLSKGDVLFYNWGEDGNPTGTAGINHATIQVGDGNTSDYYVGDYIDSHTDSRYHVLWTLDTYNLNRATTTIYLVHINA